MSSKLSTMEQELAWSQISAFIEAGMRALAKGEIPEEQDVVKMKLDYPGGYLAEDKLVKVTLILKEQGVGSHYYK